MFFSLGALLIGLLLLGKLVTTLDENNDFTAFAGVPDPTDGEEVRDDVTEIGAAQLQHITSKLEYYDVFDVVSKEVVDELTSPKIVDTRWVYDRQQDGSLRARITGRDFKWREPERETIHLQQ